jgi:Glycosyl transferase family 90
MDKEEYAEEEGPNWTEKFDTLQWSGATTGGFATVANWKALHRQRLMLSFRSQPHTLVTLLNETSPGQWDPYLSPISDLQSLFNLKITDTAQCEPEVCEAERTAFKIIPFDGEEENPNKDLLNSTYQARYALDIDGNGLSGRYYRLLKSRSVVIKQTTFKEWHDGHLVPRVYYIPLSMDGNELPEIMRFLIHDRRGRELGERIARESRSWANITLRKIDLQLAFLRLLFEYGRLMSDDRDTLNYEAKWRILAAYL